MPKKLLTLLLAMTVGGLASAATDATKVLRVGAYTSNGFVRMDDKGEPYGYGITLDRWLGAAMGRKVEFVGLGKSWAELLEMLERGEIELLDGAQYSLARAKKFDFPTEPAGYSASVVLVRTGDTAIVPDDPATWSAKRAGYIESGSMVDAFRAYDRERGLGVASYVGYPDVEGMLAALKAKDIDFAIADSAGHYDGVEVIDRVNPLPTYTIVKKGSPLLAELNAAYAKLSAANPGWRGQLERQHHDCRKVRVLLPPAEDAAALNAYCRRLFDRIAEHNDWDPVYVEDVDRAVPRGETLTLTNIDFVAASIRGARGTEDLSFPIQPAGYNQLVLARLRALPSLGPTKDRVLRIACHQSGANREAVFKRFAQERGIKYRLVPVEDRDEALGQMRAGAADCMLTEMHRVKADEFEVLLECSRIPFFFATMPGRSRLGKASDGALEMVRIYGTTFYDALRRECLNQVDTAADRVVRVCYYLEGGITEVNGNGDLDGYAVSYLRRIAALRGWRLDEIVTTFDHTKAYLERGFVDVVGCVFRTPEREGRFAYSDHDIGPLFYALMAAPTGALKPNHPQTWDNARVGVLRSSQIVHRLSALEREYGITFNTVAFDDLANAERDVRAGRLDAVYTITSPAVGDLTTLALLPSEQTYFCSNLKKPWIKEGIDIGMDELLADDPDFQQKLLDRFFPGRHTSERLDAAEVAYVKSRAQNPVKVDLSPLRPVFKTYDAGVGDATGFPRRVLDEVARITGLSFTVLEPVEEKEAARRLEGGASELRLGDEDEDFSSLNTTVLDAALRLPAARVLRKGRPLTGLRTVALARVSETQRALWRKAAITVRECPSRELCYRAVESGEADFTIDSYHVAKAQVVDGKSHPGLTIAPIDPQHLTIPLPMAFAADCDPRLVSVMRKGFAAITSAQVNAFLADSLSVTAREPLLSLTALAFIIGGVVLVALLLVLAIHLAYSRRTERALVRALKLRDMLEVLSAEAEPKEKAGTAVKLAMDVTGSLMTGLIRHNADGTCTRVCSFGVGDLPKEHPVTNEQLAQTARKVESGTFVHRAAPSDNTVFDRHLAAVRGGAVVAVPIRVGGRLWGHLATIGRTAAVAKPENVAFVEEVAHVIEIAIRRQQLTEEIAAREADRERSRAKSEFLFNMSHDIRTPLNAILGYTAMATKYENEPENVDAYLHKIDLAGQQLLELVNDVLEMSRIEAGKVELNARPCDAVERSHAMLAIATPDAAAKGVELVLEVCKIDHPLVMADPVRTNEVFGNILGNAIKFTPEGGTVTYRLEENPCSRAGYTSHTITITDTGCGMSEEFRSRIFEPFSRERSATVSRIEGTGLGMSIVKNLVDLMEGAIAVESTPGKGTKVTVTIPLKIAKLEKKDGPMRIERSSDLQNFAGMRVLLVEDNEMNREIAHFVLEEMGFRVDEANDGTEAVRKVKENKYSVVLMDIQMPIMDGYEATKAIREWEKTQPPLKHRIPPVPRHVPIIALSANAFAEDREKSISMGMDDHVAKPLKPAVLRDTLSKFL